MCSKPGSGHPTQALSAKSPSPQAAYWKSYLGKVSWVLFENGTVVLIAAGGTLDDIANRAIAFLSGLEETPSEGQQATVCGEQGWIVGSAKSKLCMFVGCSAARSFSEAVGVAHARISLDKMVMNITEVVSQ